MSASGNCVQDWNPTIVGLRADRIIIDDPWRPEQLDAVQTIGPAIVQVPPRHLMSGNLRRTWRW